MALNIGKDAGNELFMTKRGNKNNTTEDIEKVGYLLPH